MHKYAFSVVMTLLVVTACNPDKKTKVDQTTISFETNDASKLFFKNLRQTYYDKEEMVAAKMDVYRLAKRDIENDHPVINLAIVNNWRFDEAYLILEPNDLLNPGELSMNWKNEESGKSGVIRFENGNKETIVKFADQIYDQIQQGSIFSVEIGGKETDILKNPKDIETFRITMIDYYRLVQRL